jgi:hypothetical protein
MQKLQTTAGGETLSFDYTFDIPVEVAAAVCKYRHDRWKFEWSKPQFTRLDVAIGSICEILRASRCFPVRLQTQTLLDAIGTSHLCQIRISRVVDRPWQNRKVRALSASFQRALR